MAARAGMQAVELYEEPAAAAGRARGEADRLETPASAGPSGIGDARGPRRVSGRWWLVGAAVAVGLVVAQVAVGAHQRAQDARAAAIPGVVARADQTLAPVWRLDDDARRFVASAVRLGDDAIGVATAPDGSRSVTALDAATGRRQWAYALNGSDSQRAEGGDDVVQPGSCTAVPGATERVACYLTDGVSVQTGGELLLQLRPATTGRVVVLDRAGTVVADRRVPLASTFDVTSSLLLLGSSAAGQHRAVTAQDLLTGAPRWRWESATVLGGTVGLGQYRAFDVFALGDDVGVALPGGQVLVLGADGTVVHPAVDDVWSWAVRGSTAVLTVGGGATRLVRPGAADVLLRGTVVRTVVDDGSLPGLALTSEDGVLRASDARTGRTRWLASIGPQSGAVVLRGHVTILGSGALVVLDGTSGVTVSATQPAATATLTAPTSDGRHVLVAELGTVDEAATLTAYDPGGRRVWTTPLPAGTSALQQAGRQLLVYDDAGLEVLGTRE